MPGGRFRGWLALCIMTALAIGWIPGAGAQTPAREDSLDGRWLWGNLTWVDGVGGISWEASPVTEGVGGAASTSSSTDTFASAPLKEPLYLNAARLVQLDVFLQDGGQPVSCAQEGHRLRIALVAGGLHIAGAALAQRQGPSAMPPGQGMPGGFYYCKFRLPLEATFVPAGASLRLEFTFVGPPHKIGLSEEARTVVRLPVFSQEEALYRMPDVFPRLRPGQEAASGADEFLVGIAGVSAAGLLGRRKPSLLVASLLLALSLAGCASAPERRPGLLPEEEGGSSATVAYQDVGGADPDAATGSIAGRASDPYGYPVPGGIVILLGTPYSSPTDRNGLFVFPDLAAGVYALRFDATTYRSLEVEATVQPGRITRVDATLAYDTSVEAEGRPHRHDYWGAQNETLIFEGPVFAFCSEADPDCPRATGFYTSPVGADRRLVRPGTSEVEVTFEFDPAEAGYTEVYLQVQDNTDANPLNWSTFLPRKSGEPFHVKAAWETTDVGHQLFSTWTFRVVGAPGARYNSGNPVPTLVTLGEDVMIEKASIKIKRGAVPLEPAHPDPWGSADRISLGAGPRWVDYSDTAVNFAIELVCPFCQLDTLGWTLNLAACVSEPYSASAGGNVLTPFRIAPTLGQPARIVPAGTDELTVFVNQSRANGPAGLATTYDWELWYKTGETQLVPYRVGSPVYRRAPDPAVSGDGTRRVWTIPVSEGEPDGIYNKKSAWNFVLVPDDWDARCRDVYANYFSEAGFVLSIDWETMAARGLR